MQHEDLNQVEIQALVEYVNTEVQEENDRKFLSLLFFASMRSQIVLLLPLYKKNFEIVSYLF